MNISLEVDARGLRCPQPILKAKRALVNLQSGQILKVIATDNSAPNDFAAFAKQTGNELLSQEKTGAEWILILRRR